MYFGVTYRFSSRCSEISADRSVSRSGPNLERVNHRSGNTRTARVRSTGLCSGRAAALLSTLVAVVFTVAAPPVFAGEDADAILDRAETSMFPEKSIMTFEMETTRPGRSDSRLVFESKYRRGTGSLMEITEPSRSRGTRFLHLDDDLWTYNPDRGEGPIRLSPRDSFQGSTFSNRDVTDQQFSHHYAPEIVGRETLDHPWEGQVETIVLEAPADDPDAAYGSITMWVREGDHLPLRIDYESRSGVLFRRMIIGEFEERAGSVRPTKMEMRALDEADAVSTVTITSLEVPDSLSDRHFTERALTR